MLELTYNQMKQYNMEAEHAANALLRNFHTRNPFAVLNLFNAKVSTIYLTHNIGGFTDVTSKNNSIYANVYINEAFDSFSQNIIAAHELGHIIFDLDAQLNMFDNEKKYSNACDYRADLFAINFLGLVDNNSKNNVCTPENARKIVMSKLLYAKESCYVNLK